MTLALGLVVGLTFGAASASAGRLRGTVLACVPVAAWFVWLALSASSGLSATETQGLGLGLTGVVVGLGAGQATQAVTKHRGGAAGAGPDAGR
ncbi:hypothetical protein [Isoptericola sp. NPDC057559]|uniref:hypothetical protein n=1 Tax=Isoptericola sp. NPDC057559 TaxID=3346168 RepID=UPI0036BA3D1D